MTEEYTTPVEQPSRKPAAKRTKGTRFRMADLKVSTILMVVLASFMALLLVLGGLAAWFLSQNLAQIEATDRENQRLERVHGLGADMMESRVALLAAAYYQSEAARTSNQATEGKARQMLTLAQGKLSNIQANFGQFRQDMPEESEGRRLAMRLVSSYQPYMDDSIEPMVQALSDNDYTTFYFVNEEFGFARSEGFQKAINDYVQYADRSREAAKAEAGAAFNRALLAMGAAALLGLLLLVGMRLLFGRQVLQPLRQAGVYFDRIAGGDLTQRVTVQSRNEIGVLYESLRRMQESLTRTVTLVRHGVEEITLGAREIYTGNTDLSSRTEQQAAALQETAAAMEELASTVRQNTDNALQADTLAKSASDVAQRGGTAVSAVVEMMQEISTSSGKIAEIVGVIDGIAFQTNILALNAAVEAARAGEQGKGFAVVAGEVRSLAQRSAQAAREIKQLIEASQVKVDAGARQATEAGGVMREVVSSVGGVTTIMAEISSASREQSQGIEDVNRAVAEMDGVVQQNAALVQEAAVASGSLQEQADRLADAVAVFKVNNAEIIDMPKAELPGHTMSHALA